MMFLPNETESTQPYFFFNHMKCKSTLALDADDFADLIEEPIPRQIMVGEEECPQHCTKIDDLEACHNECHNAPFRRLFVNHIMKPDT
jgi:hypothetical protein